VPSSVQQHRVEHFLHPFGHNREVPRLVWS
jgi:hypothetical protein